MPACNGLWWERPKFFRTLRTKVAGGEVSYAPPPWRYMKKNSNQSRRWMALKDLEWVLDNWPLRKAYQEGNLLVSVTGMRVFLGLEWWCHCSPSGTTATASSCRCFKSAGRCTTPTSTSSPWRDNRPGSRPPRFRETATPTGTSARTSSTSWSTGSGFEPSSRGVRV